MLIGQRRHASLAFVLAISFFPLLLTHGAWAATAQPS